MKKNCEGLPGCGKKKDKLSLLKRAQNFIATSTKHLANGLKNVKANSAEEWFQNRFSNESKKIRNLSKETVFD